MTQKDPFREETREEVVKSIVNWSKSKQLWTFPKKQRFKKIKTECPHAYYEKNISTITNIQAFIPTTDRKLFEDNRMNPSPAHYNTIQQRDDQKEKGITFGESRKVCRFSSYIRYQTFSNPAPNQYDKFAPEQQSKLRKGFSLRPKTANHRTYFIDNKELAQVPSPSKYIRQKGQFSQSKFKSQHLGSTGMMKKSKRFHSSIQNPGPTDYHPNKISLKNVFIGGKMGNSKRFSFIDKIYSKAKIPGPGNYKMPSEFGHYKKIDSNRMHTIQ